MEEAIQKAGVLIEAMPYIQRFTGRPVVIKFGGSAMENEEILDDVLEDVVFLAAVGIKPIVVHGGGPQITAAMEQAGLEPVFVRGHRATDERALVVVVDVLAGQVNADIIQRIGKWGGQACSSFDGEHSPLRAHRKRILVSSEQGAEEAVDIGYVGEIEQVLAEDLMARIDDGNILVVPPIGQDDCGQLYNVNADTAAAAVAAAVKAEKIVFLSNVHGIMSDPDDPDTIMSTVREEEVEELIASDAISGGMLPKVAACIRALEGGVRKAHIIDGRLPHSLLLEIFTDRGVGTQILT